MEITIAYYVIWHCSKFNLIFKKINLSKMKFYIFLDNNVYGLPKFFYWNFANFILFLVRRNFIVYFQT